MYAKREMAKIETPIIMTEKSKIGSWKIIMPWDQYGFNQDAHLLWMVLWQSLIWLNSIEITMTGLALWRWNQGLCIVDIFHNTLFANAFCLLPWCIEFKGDVFKLKVFVPVIRNIGLRRSQDTICIQNVFQQIRIPRCRALSHCFYANKLALYFPISYLRAYLVFAW